MALLEKDGNYKGLTADIYHRIHGIFIQHGQIELRMAKYTSEQYRQENPEDAEFYNVQSVKLSDEVKEQILAIVYPELKLHKVNTGSDRHSAETDDDGKIIKEAYTEEIFDYPFADMIDC